MADTPKLTPREKPPAKAHEKNFHWNADDYHGRSTYVLPVDEKFEDVMRPEYWANVAYKFQRDNAIGRPERVGRLIEVIPQDWSFYSLLIVRAVHERSIEVWPVFPPIPIGAQAVESAGYDVRWNVGKRAHEIIRKSDKAIVASVKTREAAADWIAKTEGAAKAA